MQLTAHVERATLILAVVPGGGLRLCLPGSVAQEADERVVFSTSQDGVDESPRRIARTSAGYRLRLYLVGTIGTLPKKQALFTWRAERLLSGPASPCWSLQSSIDKASRGTGRDCFRTFDADRLSDWSLRQRT